ncbi:hypothetical protein [Gelidibacter japonicus]|uniref:hypothetical protein n=1 Tax=Gelidibacter japonicus TaxID=1962232 RepID=UPI002AFF9E01|nr:hypothetical protein [Gelidibacter japonicus]
MISFEPRIAIIDDKFEEISGILQQYQKEGIGVKYFNAHLTDPDPKPAIHFSDLNLIFLDVHFTENIDDYDPTHCAAWVDSLLPENSFYILVLWSKETDKKDEILDELKLIKKEPFLFLAEQKTDYQTKDGWDFQKLRKTIDSKLSEYPELDELSIWKKSVLHSSNIVIGHLSKNIDVEALRKKLQKIILGHGGSYLIGDDKENRKREVLFDALDNILASNSKLTRPNQNISELNKNSLYKIPDFPISDVDAKLNSWFHFKLIENKMESNFVTSGLISYFRNDSLSRNYSIQNDEIVSKYLKTQLESKETTLSDISLIISRPCDIAQNKFGRNLKMLSGILIFNPIRDGKNRFKGVGTKPLSIKLYDHLSISDIETDCAIVFDFRYAFSLPPDIFEQRFEKVKIFNKELLSEIQVEYSAYSSRLGITQII